MKTCGTCRYKTEATDHRGLPWRGWLACLKADTPEDRARARGTEWPGCEKWEEGKQESLF